MNWLDIKRSLDSEFKRLEDKRIKEMKEDEKLADFIDQHVWCNECHCIHSKPVCDDPESKGEWNQPRLAAADLVLADEVTTQAGYTVINGKAVAAGVVCRCDDSEFCPKHGKRIAAVITGSSATEFKQNWKEKAEAN